MAKAEHGVCTQLTSSVCHADRHLHAAAAGGQQQAGQVAGAIKAHHLLLLLQHAIACRVGVHRALPGRVSCSMQASGSQAAPQCNGLRAAMRVDIAAQASGR